MAESYYDWSPYNYVLNNPLLFIDPNGLWVATSGGYTTNDPNDIASFLSYVKAENAVGSASPNINQMNGFVQGEMNGGGRLSNGSYLVSEVSAVKDNGKWKPEIESYHQAWVDVYKIVSGDKLHLFPVKVNL